MSVWNILLLSCFVSQCLGSCLDTRDDCSIRAKNYDCLRVPDEMSCVCPRSCNTLSEYSDAPGELHCECLMWVQEGMCESDSKYMKEQCHETCTIWKHDTCPSPPSRANMVVSIIRGSGTRYTDVISYSCDEGYKDTSGTQSAQGMLVCDESYTWQSHGVYGDLPICETDDGGSILTNPIGFQLPAPNVLQIGSSVSTAASAAVSSTTATTTTLTPTAVPATTSSSTTATTTTLTPAAVPATTSSSTTGTTTTLTPAAVPATTSSSTTATTTTLTPAVVPATTSSSTTATTTTLTPAAVPATTSSSTTGTTTTFTPAAVPAATSSSTTGTTTTLTPTAHAFLSTNTTPVSSITILSVLGSMFSSNFNECLSINNSFINMGTTSAVMEMLTTVFGNNLLFCIRMCGMVPTCTDVQYLQGNCTLYTQAGGDKPIVASLWRKISS